MTRLRRVADTPLCRGVRSHGIAAVEIPADHRAVRNGRGPKCQRAEPR